MGLASALITVVVVVLYVALTAVGVHCAVASGRLVERALGRVPPTTPGSALVAVVKAICLLWLGGLVVLTTGGVRRAIARGAENYLDTPGILGTDRLKIRAAIRDYKRRNGLL